MSAPNSSTAAMATAAFVLMYRSTTPGAFVSGAPPRTSLKVGMQGIASSTAQARSSAEGLPSVACVAGASALLAGVLAIAASRRRTARTCSRQSAVACAAARAGASSAPEEESLKRAIWNAPTKAAKDVQRIVKEIDGLPSPPKTAMKMIEGHWKTEWNSVYGTQPKKTLMKFVHEKLPGILVSFFDSYYRISDKQVDYVEAFTMAGNERVDAALVWSGKRKKDKGNQLHFQFDSIKICPADASTGMSKEMIQSEGLGKFMKPVPITEPATYIELDYISNDMQVHHEEEPTARWIMSRYRQVPFVLD